jgi:hypothetical protein
MQGLKFQDQLSYLKKTDFLAGTAFIVGKNIDLPLIPKTILFIFIYKEQYKIIFYGGNAFFH